MEWPAQAEGRTVDRGTAYPKKLNSIAIGLKPSGVADGNLQALLLQTLTRLWDARQERLLAAEIVRFLEEAAGWALLMAVLSGIVMGAAIAAVLFGQLSCGGG